MPHRLGNPLRPTHIPGCVLLLLSSAEGSTTRATPSSHLHAAAGYRLARQWTSSDIVLSHASKDLTYGAKVTDRHNSLSARVGRG